MPVSRQVLQGKPRLASGQRDKSVTIQQRPAADASVTSGFPVESWTTLATGVFMARLELRADERFTVSQESAAAEASWHMGYRADMDPELVDVPKRRRLVYRGKVFDSVSASMIGPRRGIELMTLAGSAIA